MLLYVLLLSTSLFTVGLLAKHTLFRRLCALCVSICGSWVILLTLYKLGLFHNQLILAMLIGQSVTGIFFLVRDRVDRSLHIFTLPFFLSLTVLAYWAVVGSFTVLPVLTLLAVLWVTAYILFTLRRDSVNKTNHKLAEAVMNCCGEE